MTDNGSDDAKWNGGHDDQRLAVAAKGDGQEGKDGEQRELESADHARHGIASLLFLPFHIEGKPGIVMLEFGQQTRTHFGQDFLGVGDLAVDAGADVDHPFAVGTLDFGIAPPLLHEGSPIQWHLATLRSTDTHRLQIPQTPAVLLRIAHHHLDLVAAALQTQGLGAVKRTANLTS